MEQYEFVSRSVYGPERAELEKILQKIRSYISKNESQLDFDYELIGSGNKHLITQVVGGNRGYDFDFNLIIDNPGKDQKWVGKYVHDSFLKAIRFAVKGTDYSEPEESTSVLTIKKVDTKHKRIVCSCDFAIVYYDDPKQQYYLHFHKENGGFGFLKRSFKYDVDDVVKRILDDNPGNWNLIRDEYLKLKNNDVQKKRSFVLYVEAVRNVYDQMFNKTPVQKAIDAYSQLINGGFY